MIFLKATKSGLVPIAVLILCCLAFLLFSFISCERIGKMVSALARQSPRTIVVDAGHGGEDGGAVTKSGVAEKTINLAIAKDLQQLLQAAGFQVVMTRTSDESIADDYDTIRERKTSDIHNRMGIIEAQGDCVFVSIHQNQFPQGQYHGAQIFYSKNTEDSKALAEIIRGKITGLLQSDNTRQIKPATSSIYLLYHAKVPAVLVECGFLSNESEAALLQDEKYQKQMAFAIYCGLLEFCVGSA